MFHPIPTSSQVAQHDAWLAEMRKEPLQGAGKPARLRVHRRLLSRLGKWLVATGLRLQTHYRQEGAPAPEAQVHANGTSAV
jgi:DMSO/TMAO reductase YedYZ molybdopterin-dependent catalytic subunit